MSQLKEVEEKIVTQDQTENNKELGGENEERLNELNEVESNKPVAVKEIIDTQQIEIDENENQDKIERDLKNDEPQDQENN